MWDSIINSIFVENQKFITSNDMDGKLAGMLLQKYLNWEFAGLCDYNGQSSDEIWLVDPDFDLLDAVFVGVPVSDPDIFCIDSHFIAPDKAFIDTYMENGNKINPNVINGLVRWKDDNSSDFDQKYSFGTAHFVAETLINLGIVSGDILKKIDDLLSLDLDSNSSSGSNAGSDSDIDSVIEEFSKENDIPLLPFAEMVPFEGLNGKKDAVHKAVLNNVINVYDTFAFSFDSNYTISFTVYE